MENVTQVKLVIL